MAEKLYLTGQPTAEQEAVAPSAFYYFESIALTEDFYMKLIGTRITDQVRQQFTLVVEKPPHPDLLKVLRRLTLHMCLLTEQLTDTLLYPNAEILPRFDLRRAVDSGEAYVHPLLESFRCTSVLWKSKGIVLAGERKTRYRCFGKHLEIKSPVTIVHLSLDDNEAEEEDNYPFFEEMDKALADLRAEATAYLDGKYGEFEEQLSLFGKDAEVLPANETGASALAYTVSARGEDGQYHDISPAFEQATRSFNGVVLDDESQEY